MTGQASRTNYKPLWLICTFQNLTEFSIFVTLTSISFTIWGWIFFLRFITDTDRMVMQNVNNNNDNLWRETVDLGPGTFRLILIGCSFVCLGYHGQKEKQKKTWYPSSCIHSFFIVREGYSCFQHSTVLTVHLLHYYTASPHLWPKFLQYLIKFKFLLFIIRLHYLIISARSL